ncbi:MAG TPA: glutamine-hydrolyzing carbamoyl-phosphate synthase small subunit [Cyclobacteriaceae bacterium]|nr:glutamine-hydrolyzing carbamoyl-phosphate synthase small subunit [Cyclobacteriaceae bacterium]MCB9237214.1 glutamine-hydrolyzing carbamoyl-phosphate synthase small subunit [Flammeovirgaceae bacterium]MCB0499968.1 glutamine-hydrolyzing carbamoyl-phosphate synthase small subunit [Cyclobacteriaceae bacterium]MCO5270924.1 glutamine-hydrolyzing carbamoyl-phosphate synthase small subunit [Cyclobacteriaceae bacterium]MCW5901790.1 glutamine-hydrolyzing carbamoyl-phosphate synthase small subunit [Cyc
MEATNKAYLLLEDGLLVEGKAIGKRGTSGGEICFNTGMTGYQEIYTDPSYYGQIVVNTTAHIGNYGSLDLEQESDGPKIKGLVVNEFSDEYSRKTATESLQSYLEKNNVVGISDVDTRMLVRHIRDKGAMNAIISSELGPEDLKKELKKVPSMDGLELASVVSTKKPYLEGDANAPYKVAVLDVGIKKSILANLAARGCHMQVFPAKTTFAEMEKWGPDGYFVSNGPGDPATMDYGIKTVREIMDSGKPLFGICLGHQLLALANGISTYKMHNGHRGLNHPVKNLLTGLGEMTSQNHGFAVSEKDIDKNENVEVTHIHLNDKTIMGLRVKTKKAFSVQYHPEASPGPHDSRYLFDQFVEMIKKSRLAEAVPSRA